jgi:hypothetical protein
VLQVAAAIFAARYLVIDHGVDQSYLQECAPGHLTEGVGECQIIFAGRHNRNSYRKTGRSMGASATGTEVASGVAKNRKRDIARLGISITVLVCRI